MLSMLRRKRIYDETQKFYDACRYNVHEWKISQRIHADEIRYHFLPPTHTHTFDPMCVVNFIDYLFAVLCRRWFVVHIVTLRRQTLKHLHISNFGKRDKSVCKGSNTTDVSDEGDGEWLADIAVREYAQQIAELGSIKRKNRQFLQSDL